MEKIFLSQLELPVHTICQLFMYFNTHLIKVLKIFNAPLHSHIPLPSRKFVNCYMWHEFRFPSPGKILSVCETGREGSSVPGVWAGDKVQSWAPPLSRQMSLHKQPCSHFFIFKKRVLMPGFCLRDAIHNLWYIPQKHQRLHAYKHCKKYFPNIFSIKAPEISCFRRKSRL